MSRERNKAQFLPRTIFSDANITLFFFKLHRNRARIGWLKTVLDMALTHRMAEILIFYSYYVVVFFCYSQCRFNLSTAVIFVIFVIFVIYKFMIFIAWYQNKEWIRDIWKWLIDVKHWVANRDDINRFNLMWDRIIQYHTKNFTIQLFYHRLLFYGYSHRVLSWTMGNIQYYSAAVVVSSIWVSEQANQHTFTEKYHELQSLWSSH